VKIAVVYPFPAPIGRNRPRIPGGVLTGGGETFPLRLAASMSREGLDVDYLTGRLPGVSSHVSKIGRMKVRYFPITIPGNLIHHSFSFGLFLRLLFGGYDAYVSWQIPTILSLLTGIAAKLRGRRFVVGYLGLRPGISRSTKIYTMMVSRLADAVIVPNRFSRKFIDPYFRREKIFQVPYSVDVSGFRRHHNRLLESKIKRGGEKLLLFVGRLLPNKGIDILIRATKHLRDSGIKVRLALIGEGPMRGRLESLCSDLQVSEYVDFLGFVRDSDLPHYYSAADVTVLPSVYRDSYGGRHPEPEAFGLVLAESMSCGTPVVATKVGGVPEWIKHGENGMLATPGDYKDLASKIKHVLNNRYLSRRLVAKGALDLKSKYSFDATIKRYIDVICGNSKILYNTRLG